MGSNPLELPKEWKDKIETDARSQASLQFHSTYSPDQHTACMITYRQGAMAYAQWLYTCQTNYAALKERCDKMEAAFTGSVYSNPAPGISLGCISPDARDLLDTVMGAWESHYKALKETSKDNEPTFYGFAYWLIRWSGLVQPAACKGKEKELKEPLIPLAVYKQQGSKTDLTNPTK